jgi:hypothetical protein
MRRWGLLVLTACAAPLAAHEVITTKITFSQEISRLFYKKCVSCHREGGQAPFSLMTWEEARPWAKAIKEEVLERRMPPFAAVKGFGEFRDDLALTMEEVKLVADWVEGGAPAGKEIYLPKPPKFEPAKPAAAPRGSVEIAVKDTFNLAGATRVVAVRPKQLERGASVQVIATKPDGSIEPLIWINNYQPNFARTYLLAEPLSLPAGTRIEVSPAGAGVIAVYRAAGGGGPTAKKAE